MSREIARLVRVDLDEDRRRLVEAAIEAEKTAQATSSRSARELYDDLCGRLERAATIAMSAGAESIQIAARFAWSPTFADPSRPERLPHDGAAAEAWLRAGAMAVELRDPFGRGPTLRARPLPAPATMERSQRWSAPFANGDAVGAQKSRELRFRERVDEIVRGGRATLVPTGVAGRALTEGLRDIASGPPRPQGTPVVYRDGSTGQDFPVGGLGHNRTRIRAGQTTSRTLRLALLSLRHLELDAGLDGAILPGSLISQPRPAGEIDDLVYRESIVRLVAMRDQGPFTLCIYQPGAASVITGFYRAVVEVLRDWPGLLTVVPYCRQAPTGTETIKFTEATSWET